MTPDQLLRSSAIFPWWDWGIIIGFFVALGASLWVFYTAQQNDEDATAWKSLAAVGTVLIVPFLLARLSWSFALSVITSLELLGYLSLVGVVASIGAGVGYAATMRRRPAGQTTSTDEWPGIVGVYPPFGATPEGTEGGDPVNDGGTLPGASVGPEAAPGPGAYQPGVTLVDGKPIGAGATSDRGTVFLTREPEPLGLLMIVSGPRAGYHFRLNTPVASSGVAATRIGRSGDPALRNDEVIDDDTVSGEHLSIRYSPPADGAAQGAFILQDIGSANGTKVNGRDEVKRSLQDKDVITIGHTDLVFRYLEPVLARR